MNTGHYYSYIISSEYYKNLTNAANLIDELSKDIINLKLVLTDASGEIITEMSNDLSKLEKELNSYKTMAKNIQNDLKANAVTFDGVYNNWQKKIGEVIDEGFYNPQDGLKYSTMATSDDLYYSINSSTGLAGTKKISSVLDIPKIQKQETTKVWAYKYKTVLSRVYIESGDNKIHLEYTDNYYCYTKNVMLINVYIDCVDIFKEENRDTTKDYSKISKNGVVDFMNSISSKNTSFLAPK